MSKIILKENVRKLGKIGDVVSVKNGYAFNFLIPTGRAIPATKKNIEILDTQIDKMLLEDKKKKEDANSILQQMPQEIFLDRKINENGVLYATISQKDILDAIDILKEKYHIHFERHIHNYGVHHVEIELHHDVIAKISVSIADTIENAKKQMRERKEGITKVDDNTQPLKTNTYEESTTEDRAKAES